MREEMDARLADVDEPPPLPAAPPTTDPIDAGQPTPNPPRDAGPADAGAADAGRTRRRTTRRRRTSRRRRLAEEW